MDRFEVDSWRSYSIISEIYIPVWIDLKKDYAKSFYLSKSIYIPVWIDLKA